MKGRAMGALMLETREARSRERACWRAGLSCIQRPVVVGLVGVGGGHGSN